GELVVNFTSTTDYKRVFSYTTVSMPATFQLSVNGTIGVAGSIGHANVQLGTYERIEVPFQVTAVKVASGTYTPVVDGKTLTTQSVTTEGKSVSIVWYGTATVYAISGTVVSVHEVMFASSKPTFTIPSINNRHIVYKLYAAVGALVDESGAVLETTTATYSENGVVVKGQTIPTCQFIAKNGTGYTVTFPGIAK
ncbi:MAG: hypothetical protein RR338_06150, partial [Clostridia bacterium]